MKIGKVDERHMKKNGLVAIAFGELEVGTPLCTNPRKATPLTTIKLPLQVIDMNIHGKKTFNITHGNKTSGLCFYADDRIVFIKKPVIKAFKNVKDGEQFIYNNPFKGGKFIKIDDTTAGSVNNAFAFRIGVKPNARVTLI